MARGSCPGPAHPARTCPRPLPPLVTATPGLPVLFPPFPSATSLVLKHFPAAGGCPVCPPLLPQHPAGRGQGAPLPPLPGAGKQGFNGTAQRMAALGSHLVISQAPRRHSSALAKSVGKALAPVQSPPDPPSETPA